MAMQEWERLRDFEAAMLQKVKIYRSKTDGAGEAMLGAITIPDLTYNGLFFGKMFVAIVTDFGTTTSSTDNTGFQSIAHSDLLNPEPTIGGLTIGNSLRWLSSGTTGMEVNIRVADWDTVPSWVQAGGLSQQGNQPDNSEVVRIIGNKFAFTYAIGSLAGDILLKEMIVMFVPSI